MRPRQTIPFTTSVSPETAVKISDEDWTALESAYGHLLSSDVREELIVATTKFLLFEEAERNAEQVSAAQDRVAAINLAARKLFEILNTTANTDATVYADNTIDLHLGDGLDLDRFSAQLRSFSSACGQASRELLLIEGLSRRRLLEQLGQGAHSHSRREVSADRRTTRRDRHALYAVSVPTSGMRPRNRATHSLPNGFWQSHRTSTGQLRSKIWTL